MEGAIAELYDFHASLGTNNDSSPRLVPSGTDLIAAWNGTGAMVEQVRIGSLAEKAGIAHSDEIMKIQDKTARDAALSWIYGVPTNPREWNWGLKSALAGRWNVSDVFSSIMAATCERFHWTLLQHHDLKRC